jgi:hypothetical protein
MECQVAGVRTGGRGHGPAAHDPCGQHKRQRDVCEGGGAAQPSTACRAQDALGVLQHAPLIVSTWSVKTPNSQKPQQSRTPTAIQVAETVCCSRCLSAGLKPSPVPAVLVAQPRSGPACAAAAAASNILHPKSDPNSWSNKSDCFASSIKCVCETEYPSLD